MAFFDDIGKKLTQTGQDTVKKAKDMAEVSRLNGQLTDAGRRLQETYAKLGEHYFGLYSQNGEEALNGYCTAIQSILDEITATRGEIQRLKNAKVCPQCGAENPAATNFCSGCGTKLPETPKAEGQSVQRCCTACGAVIAADAVFCTKCGVRQE